VTISGNVQNLSGHSSRVLQFIKDLKGDSDQVDEEYIIMRKETQQVLDRMNSIRQLGHTVDEGLNKIDQSVTSVNQHIDALHILNKESDESTALLEGKLERFKTPENLEDAGFDLEQDARSL